MSIRIPAELDQRVGEVSKIIGMKKPEVYRLSIKQGVEAVLVALSIPTANQES